MDDAFWTPFRPLPEDLVWPRSVDPAGVEGPTMGQARGPGWRRANTGRYVPADTVRTLEQTLLETACRLKEGEAMTGWAALRWRGAAYFDGRAVDGEPRPVSLIRWSGTRNVAGSGVFHHRCQLAPYDTELVAGLRCTSTARAVFDEMRFAPSLRQAVVALDMTAAAELISVRQLAEYAAHRHAWTGVPQVREAVGLASDTSRSPQESRLRLVWLLDAGLAEPLCNVPVFDLEGNLLGVPDLLDPAVGLVVEYDGWHHKARRQHRRDVAREHRFREHGLEYAAVVGGDLRDRGLVVARLLAAHRRARLTPPSARAWTLTPPRWWQKPEPLDVRLRRERPLPSRAA